MKNMRRCLLKTRNQVSLCRSASHLPAARSHTLRLQTVYLKLPNRANFQPKIFLLCRPCFTVSRFPGFPMMLNLRMHTIVRLTSAFIAIPLSYLRWFCLYITFLLTFIISSNTNYNADTLKPVTFVVHSFAKRVQLFLFFLRYWLISGVSSVNITLTIDKAYLSLRS